MSDSITCPECGSTSYHPVDVEQGYCARCKSWTQPPLFERLPRSEPVRKAAAPKSVAFGVCPNHPWQLRLTGLVRHGRHLYWRGHSVPAARGHRPRWCTASDAPLHTVAALQMAHQPCPTCPCGQSGPDSTI